LVGFGVARAVTRGVIRTDIPARLDRLPWSRFHWLVVGAIGATRVFDGLEVTLVGSVASALQLSPVLRMTGAEVGGAASVYLLGNIFGALFFGWLTDRLGRKRLFNITLGLYIAATAATACSFDFWSFLLFRFLTGAGIGGEGVAIGSAVQEYMPAAYRGRVDIILGGTFWVGAALGALVTIPLLDPRLLGPDHGWRMAFAAGAALSLIVLYLRRFIPESPRWLITHGRIDEAERITRVIETDVARQTGTHRSTAQAPTLGFTADSKPVSPRIIFDVLVHRYRSRTVLCVILIATQAFFYNAIFFTYALVLARFYGIAAHDVGWYIVPFAAGNFLGPLLLGKLFDTVGRRQMIAITYGLSAVLLAVTAALFGAGVFTAATQTLAWAVTFFFASAGASAAYLTVAESFPLEIRAIAISLFYTAGTLIGGVAAPVIFGRLIDRGERIDVVYGYLLGAALMLLGAIVELCIGIRSERMSLEEIAPPLSSWDAPD
jgi:MFS family permease